jgi:hypothetical protein
LEDRDITDQSQNGQKAQETTSQAIKAERDGAYLLSSYARSVNKFTV